MPDQSSDHLDGNKNEDIGAARPLEFVLASDSRHLPLSINVCAKMAIQVGIEKSYQRYRKVGELRALNDEAEGRRILNTLSVLEKMTDVERTRYFVDSFRNDPDLQSGLSAFNRLVGGHFDLLDAALKKACASKLRSLQQAAEI